MFQSASYVALVVEQMKKENQNAAKPGNEWNGNTASIAQQCK